PQFVLLRAPTSPGPYTLPLHDALPISLEIVRVRCGRGFTYRDAAGVIRDTAVRARLTGLAIPPAWCEVKIARDPHAHIQAVGREDRKSTRLNSSHVKISYAVFCLKKKK